MPKVTSPDPRQLRRLPSMETILSSDEIQPLLERYGRERVKQAFRQQLDAVRTAGGTFDLGSAAASVSLEMEEQSRLPLQTVINATGVLIHTNLGRSPLSRQHLESAEEQLASYCNLEIDLGEGSRGSRHHHIVSIARDLFDCESALLTNNNAAAMLLALSALAPGRNVIVSRGELVEIGGSFRVPDIIQQGGAILREVGTTNRTRAGDYEEAIDEGTAAILVVHQSNFAIVGFTEQPELAELVAIAHSRRVPLIVDEGSGRVVDLSPYGLPRKETLREMLEMGVDLVASSTDKLIGATQGGLLLGREDLIARCRTHPLMRALRPGKESFALVTAALSAFQREQHERELPLYVMLSTPLEMLWKRATRLAKAIDCEIVETQAVIGGGTTPAETIPSIALAIRERAVELHELLRQSRPAVVGRLHEERLLLDLRSVLPEQDDALAEILAGAAHSAVAAKRSDGGD